MGLFHHESEQAKAHAEVVGAEHKAQLSHELIAAAASYEAAKAYEEHCEQDGHPDTHARAEELLAAFTGGFIDRIVETKGLDYVDKVKAQRDAQRQAQRAVDESPEYTFHRG